MTSPSVLLEFLMEHGGYSTRTRARTAIKGGAAAVDGKIVRIPSTLVNEGSTVTWRALQKADAPKDFDFNSKPATEVEAKPPFEIAYEDDFILAYIKPAGIVFASPKPQVKTSFTLMKTWMEKYRPQCTTIQFVNRIEKESSGISIIAKDLIWRKHLQEHWARFAQRMYVLVDGHLPADDVLFCMGAEQEGKKKQKREFPYRTMRATASHTMLKIEMSFDDVPDLMSGLRRNQCMLIGKGKEAPDPLGRSGLHLFGIDVEGPNGEAVQVKSRVPQEFLKLMKGGKGPKADPRGRRRDSLNSKTDSSIPSNSNLSREPRRSPDASRGASNKGRPEGR